MERLFEEALEFRKTLCWIYAASPQRQEAAFLPRPSYMETQQDINGKMRAILVDWLVEAEA